MIFVHLGILEESIKSNTNYINIYIYIYYRTIDLVLPILKAVACMHQSATLPYIPTDNLDQV